MSEPLHPVDALHEALDGRLGGAASAALDRHLSTCAQCRAEMEALRWTKAQAAALARQTDVPSDFDARLRQCLDRADASPVDVARGAPPADGRASTRSRWWLSAAALAAAVLLVVWAWPRLAGSGVPAQIADDYRAYQAGTLPLTLRTDDVAQIEALFARSSLGFQTRVFDLAMMGYQAVGGAVHRIGDRPSALFAYRGPRDLELLCQMYLGRTNELPAPDRRASDNGTEFLIYRQSEITLVFWQEGDVVCVLAGTGDPQTVLDLAVAKAIRRS